MLGNSGEGLRLGLLGLVGQDTEIVLPPSAARLLVDLLSNMAEGNGVSLIPVRAELTTQQAADLLNVSRKFLIDELLNGGALPYRKVGTHRRIPLRDLLNYKQDNRAKRLAAIDEMVENDQSIGLY
jgi:excisionase family DNA binding protein